MEQGTRWRSSLLRRRRRFSLDATRTLVWTIILVVIASASGGYWFVRGVERDDIVNRGAGLVEQPGITCSFGYHSTPVCTKNVKVFVDASHQLLTQTDTNGLYARAESSPGKTFDVQSVYIDTTNDQVDKVVYAGTTYQLETTQGSFLVLGIVVLVVDAGGIGFLVYLVRRRHGRGHPVS